MGEADNTGPLTFDFAVVGEQRHPGRSEARPGQEQRSEERTSSGSGGRVCPLPRPGAIGECPPPRAQGPLVHQRPGLLRTPLRDKLPRGRLSPDPESPLATAPSSLAQRYEPTPTALSPGAAPTGPHGCGPRPSQQRRHLETCRMVRPKRKGIKRSPNTFKAISRFAKHPNVRFRPIPVTRYWLQAVLRLKGSLTSLSPREGTRESATPNQPLTSGHARAPTQAPRQVRYR